MRIQNRLPVAQSMKMAELFLGQTFDSQQEAQQFVASYCARNYHPVRQRHNVTVASYNKKVVPDSRLPEEIKYQQMHWECKHFGVHKSRGNNKRDFECVLAKDCKFQISVTFNRLQGKFVVTTALLDHENHEVSESLYPQYADHRKLNTEQLQEVDSMLLTDVKPTLVAEALYKEGVPVHVKDLYNRKQKLMKFENDIDETVLSALNHPHIVSRRITDEHNKFEVLFFQTYTQRKLFANFGEVVQLDIYTTRLMRLPLCTLLVIDNNGIGQPIAFGILVKKDQQHIANFLEIFKELNDLTNLQCAIIVHKDMAVINAFRKLLPTKCIQVCYFHIMKVIDMQLRTLKIENETECRQKFDRILKSKTDDDFAREINELAFLSPAFHRYVVQHWLPLKDNITLFGCSDVMHLQNRIDDRVESFHNILKEVASSSRTSLNVLIENLLSLVAELAYESVNKNFDVKTKEFAAVNPDLENYYGLFTDYAASLIGKEMEKTDSGTYRVLNSCDGKLLVRSEETRTIYEVSGSRCSCNMPANMGLPCRHLIAAWKMAGETLFQPNSVANRWKRDLDDHLDASGASAPSSSTVAADSTGSSTSRIQRFNTAMTALNDLASFVAEQPKAKFDDFITSVDLFKSAVKTGNVSSLVETLQPANNNTKQFDIPEMKSDA